MKNASAAGAVQEPGRPLRKRVAGLPRRRGVGRLAAALLGALVSLPPPVGAPAATVVTEIAENSIWEGAVEVTREVRVLKGATLLVQPGTTIRFAARTGEASAPAARLLVEGTLVAQGTADEPILFTSAAADPRPGDWGGIVLEHTKERANRMRNVRIEYAVTGLRGAYALLLAEDLELRGNETGLSALTDLHGRLLRARVTDNGTGLAFNQNSTLRIEGCTVSGNAGTGVSLRFGSSPTIVGSTIADNGGTGILCVRGASPSVEGNTIRGNPRGISMELQCRPRILRNLIEHNGTGIWAEKLVFPRIEGNTIAANGTGIYCNFSAYPAIHGNNITGNEGHALVLGDNMSIIMQRKIPFRGGGSFSFEPPPGGEEALPAQSRKFQPFTASDEGIVDARGNWWGAEAAAEMERVGEGGNVAVIEDFHDKPDTWYGEETYRRDRVVFAPWEREPVPDAAPPEDAYSGIAGKVVEGGKPVPGVRVHAYADAAAAFRGEGQSYSAPSARDGSFSLEMPPGAYFLLAKGPAPPFPQEEPGEGAFFGYYGGNPVTVSPGTTVTATVNVVRRAGVLVSPFGRGDSSRLEGVVLGPGGPVEGAAVHVYIDASRQFRGPDLFGPQGAVAGGTDEKGAFSVDLPPGSYFLVASRRQGGEMLGPLKAGDLHGYFDGNPVSLEAGARTAVTIRVAEKLRDVAAAAGPGAGSTGIRGTVRSPSGPVPAGVYAYATTDPSFMIGAMPPFRSRPVGPDGSFFIDVPAAGTYYVSARTGYGGPPLPGEWHGFHGVETPRAVPVETGRVTEEIDLTIKRME